MTSPRPTDPWKLARLVLMLGVMITFLGFGSYAWLRYGVPESPYGDYFWNVFWVGPRRIDPFQKLQWEYSDRQLVIRRADHHSVPQ